MENMLYFRPLHFLIQFMWNYKYYSELLNFLYNVEINPVDFMIRIVEDKDHAPASVRTLFINFIDDSYNEWFDTREDLVKYYSRLENFTAISKGGFGKLNHKYTYKILLDCKKDFDKYLFDLALVLLKKRGALDKVKKQQLEEIFKYIGNIYIDFSGGINSIENVRILEFDYNIPLWKKEAYQSPLFDYLHRGTRVRFFIPEQQKTKLTNLYNQYKVTDINQTLRKMVEYIDEHDLFYKVNAF